MEQMIKLQIDRHTIEVAQGTTLLSAARSAGINIPTLCHLDMKDMCIKKRPGLLPGLCRGNPRQEKSGSGMRYTL